MCMVQHFKRGIQTIAQHHRIIAGFECREPLFCRKRDIRRGEHTGERGLGVVVGLIDDCVLAMLCDELCRGVKEVQ